MRNIINNFKEGVTTTIFGFMLLIANFYYLIEKDGNATIFFGLLFVSFALFFAPDDLINGVRNLIRKNQNKRL